MRIAFIVGGFPKISETFILNQITGLIDLGHEIDIYARRSLTEEAVHAEVIQYNLLPKTHYFDLPTSRSGRVLRALRTLAIEFPSHPSAMTRCLNLRRYKSLYSVLNNIMHLPPFLSHRYDGVMCQYETNGVDFIFLKDIFPDLKFVTMFHKFMLGDEKGSHVYARLREHGDVFLSISDSYNRKKLVEFGFDNRRIVTHRLGVDVSNIEFKVRQKSPSQLNIVTVARLHPEKGLEYGIRAIRELIARENKVKIQYGIIGNGEHKAALNDLIVSLGMQSYIQLLGPLPTAEVIKWMHASHIFLLPSLAEGTPTVLLEAQASGMPVIATAVGGVGDIVSDGKSGFIVPPADVPALFSKLKYLLDHQEDWEKMGAYGRQFVEQYHDIKKLDRRLAAIFDGLVNGGIVESGVYASV